MFVIKYTPCALNSTGKGAETFYNEDGAVNAADLAALFATAKATRGLLGIDVYEAQLISCASSAVLHLGGGYVNDSIAPDDELALAYSHAFLINGGTVDGGKIDVPGGGGTPAQVVTRTIAITEAQMHAANVTPIVLVPAGGANIINQFIIGRFEQTLSQAFVGSGPFQVCYANDLQNPINANSITLAGAGFNGVLPVPQDYSYGDGAGSAGPLNQALVLVNLGAALTGGVGTTSFSITSSILDLS